MTVQDIYDKIFNPFETQMLKTGLLHEKVLKFGELCSKSNSEIYKNLAAREDNDFKALGLHNKALREKKVETWNDNWKDKFLKSDKIITYIEDNNKGKFIFNCLINNEEQTIDYFPKANKILIRKDNSWKTKGLNWMIKNILNQ